MKCQRGAVRWLALTGWWTVTFAFIRQNRLASPSNCVGGRSLKEFMTKTLPLPLTTKQYAVSGDDDTNNNDELLLHVASSATVEGVVTSSSFVLVRPEEEESSCLPPGRLPELKLIFLVSDATGVTARSTLLKSLAQFDTCTDDYRDDNSQGTMNSANAAEDVLFGGTCDVRTRTFTFIRSPQALTQILKTALEKKACVMYTMADPDLRQVAHEYCTLNHVPHIDLMGPPLDILGKFLDKEPLGIPSRLSPRTKRKSHYLGDSYYKRIDAVEFALKTDDGQSPWLLPEADIVLVGVSRSGKTPLSVVLSQTMSFKVANIPLVMEVPPPAQLLDQVDPRRIFCLTIAPSELRKIRISRLERRGVKRVEDKHGDGGENYLVPKSNYADRNYLLRDLASARQLCQEHHWTEIDVTGRAVEETATYIVELFNERFYGHDGEDGSTSSNTLRSQSVG